MRCAGLIVAAAGGLSACQLLDDHRVQALVDVTTGEACVGADRRFGDPTVVGASPLEIHGDAASLLFAFEAPGTFELSTMANDLDGLIVRVVLDGETWTTRSDAPQDPIEGTAEVRATDPYEGRLDVSLTGVVLEHLDDGTRCTLSGTVRSLGEAEDD